MPVDSSGGGGDGWELAVDGCGSISYRRVSQRSSNTRAGLLTEPELTHWPCPTVPQAFVDPPTDAESRHKLRHLQLRRPTPAFGASSGGGVGADTGNGIGGGSEGGWGSGGAEERDEGRAIVVQHVSRRGRLSCREFTLIERSDIGTSVCVRVV